MARAKIKVEEYAARRAKLCRALGDAVAVVFAGEPSGGHGHFRPDSDFRYLTGIADEPGAILLIEPKHPVKARRETLFLTPRDPDVEKWDGRRDPISGAMKARLGFQSVFRTNNLGRWLRDAMTRSKALACVHPFAQHNQPVSPDFALFKRVSERVPGVEVIDRTGEVAKLRSVKSKGEVAAISDAIDATLEGHRRFCAALEPGVTEQRLQAELEHGFAIGGGTGHSFDPIVGSGANATVLHYISNNGVAQDGELVLLDCGTTVNGYASDITRCFPVSGKFNKRQREIYGIVLKALKASTAAVKPGATLAQLDAIARRIIDDAGYGDCFFHSIGHHLGVDVHDANPNGPLKAGAVITIEPGIYLEDEGLGVRIEDDILVTPKGKRNLSSHIPREIADVEAFIRECKKGK